MYTMKTKRHAKILEIIRNTIIEKQEDLSKELNKAGYKVTQATISRDIRELNLSKVPVAGGKQKYAVLDSMVNNMSEKFARVFKEGFVSVDRANNMVVIKTLSGMAMAVGAAIDEMQFENVLGTIAGDDTIFAVLREPDDALKFMDQIVVMAEK